MDANIIMTLISSLGFPIVSAVALFWYCTQINKQSNERLDKMQAEHKEEIAKVTEALSNNTMAIQRLCDKLDK